MPVPALQTIRRRVRQARNILRSRAVILLYHRVADVPVDPQLLCVTPRNFAEHLEVIRQFGEPTRLDRLDDALRRGAGGRPRIVLTFDDGYADNLLTAKPLLEQAAIPATVFVATGPLASPREFWQDDLERVFLQPSLELPRDIALTIDGRTCTWMLPAQGAAVAGGDAWRSWNVESPETPTPRHQMYRSVFSRLLHSTPSDRRRAADRLLGWAGLDRAPRLTHRPLTPEEVAQLAGGDLIEVGAHTVNHPVLSTLPEGEQEREIGDSRKQLESLLGRSVTSFAYPYGTAADYTQQTIAAVRRAGFTRACANFSGVVVKNSDRWQLPRILVRNWTGEQFTRRMAEWLN